MTEIDFIDECKKIESNMGLNFGYYIFGDLPEDLQLYITHAAHRWTTRGE